MSEDTNPGTETRWREALLLLWVAVIFALYAAQFGDLFRALGLLPWMS